MACDDLLDLYVGQVLAGLGPFDDFGTSRLRNAVRSDEVEDAARQCVQNLHTLMAKPLMDIEKVIGSTPRHL